MKKYNVPAGHVIRHYDVTGKTCPAPYVLNAGKHTWDAFWAAIAGKVSEKPSAQPPKTEQAFTVRVATAYLNIRKGPGTNFDKTGKHTGIGTFTIVETRDGTGSSSGWGRLKSGAGWISLDYAKRA